jgi:hypothetical protein
MNEEVKVALSNALTTAKCVDVEGAVKILEAAKLVPDEVAAVPAFVAVLQRDKSYFFPQASTASASPPALKNARDMTDAEFERAKARFTRRGNPLAGLSIAERMQAAHDNAEAAAAEAARVNAELVGKKSALDMTREEYDAVRGSANPFHDIGRARPGWTRPGESAHERRAAEARARRMSEREKPLDVGAHVASRAARVWR